MSIKEGWVNKCGGSIKTWKKRWLVLSGNTLNYYVKQNDTKSKGTITLDPSMKAKLTTCAKSSNAFSIETAGREYIMYPKDKTKEECESWVEKINFAISNQSKSFF
jgi:hypothetical protein